MNEHNHQNIYVVEKSHSDYDDNWTEVIAVLTSVEAADAMCLEFYRTNTDWHFGMYYFTVCLDHPECEPRRSEFDPSPFIMPELAIGAMVKVTNIGSNAGKLRASMLDNVYPILERKVESRFSVSVRLRAAPDVNPLWFRASQVELNVDSDRVMT